MSQMQRLHFELPCLACGGILCLWPQAVCRHEDADVYALGADDRCSSSSLTMSVSILKLHDDCVKQCQEYVAQTGARSADETWGAALS